VPAALRRAALAARLAWLGHAAPARAAALRWRTAGDATAETTTKAAADVAAADASAVTAQAAALAASGDAEAALALIEAGPPALPAAALAVGVSAATALGRFAAADALIARGDAADADAALRLAHIELAFRRGDFAAARRGADALIAAEGAALEAPAGWTREAAQALVWRAFAATWQGERAAASADVGHGGPITGPWPELRAQIAYLDALLRYYSGELDAARRAFRALADEPLAPAIAAAARAGLGLCAQREGDATAARQAYAESRRLAEQAGDRARVLNMTMNIATLDHEAGDLGAALAGYDRVVEAAARLGNEGARVRALVNRGNLYSVLGLADAALTDLDAALPALSASGNGYLEGNVACVLAELARQGGRLDEAARWIARAEAALEHAGAESELVEIRLEAAWLALARGDDDAAEGIVREAEGRAASLASAELTARARHAAARLALARALAAGERAGAEAALGRALGALREAAAAMPASKPLGVIRVEADRALLLAACGHGDEARRLARTTAERLGRVGASLEPALRARFAAAPALSPLRHTLWLCARLDDAGGARGTGEAGAAVSGGELTIGRAAHYAVMAINQRLSAEHDLARLLETLMDSAITLTGAERGFLLLDSREGDLARAPLGSELEVAVARNLDGENLRRPQHKLSHSLALEVFASGEPVLATDAQLDPRFAEQESVHSGSLRSILCVPLISRGRTIGALYVDNRFTSGAFSREHGAILEALASQAAIAIHTARLIARLRQREAELEQSRAEVVGLNARLEAELASTEDALVEARRQLVSERDAAARRADYEAIRGESPQLHALFRLIDRVRDHDFPVLVVGESGTGKELVARAVHVTGARKGGPFVAINCGALPESLLESELFGHVRGAFTGAVGDRRGLFEQADGGTLFLDEIGEMPLSMQVKLLRVLQTGEITRVGGAGTRRVAVRVLAATHRDLDRMVREGTFREDLLFRLRVVDLPVPALRQREGDLELLADHFLAANRAAGIGAVRSITKGALRRMRAYPWPGNVRELETFLKSACLFAEGEVLDVADVAPLLERALGHAAQRQGGAPASAAAALAGAGAAPAGRWSAEGSLAEVERAVVLARLQALGGNKRAAAESLGIDRSTLYHKLRGWGVHGGEAGG
jgi:transcriptional regulator with GAF, ATPase, and Fis domain